MRKDSLNTVAKHKSCRYPNIFKLIKRLS